MRSCGQQRQARRHFLCGPKPGGGQRAGRRPPGAHRPERHRQQAQPHGDRRGDHLADGKGPSAHPYHPGLPQLRPAQGFGGSAGADPHPGQKAPAGAHGPGGRPGNAPGRQRHCRQLWPEPGAVGIKKRGG